MANIDEYIAEGYGNELIELNSDAKYYASRYLLALENNDIDDMESLMNRIIEAVQTRNSIAEKAKSYCLYKKYTGNELLAKIDYYIRFYRETHYNYNKKM